MINLDEIEKLQIAIDIADAVYFLHNLTPVSIKHSAILDAKFWSSPSNFCNIKGDFGLFQ